MCSLRFQGLWFPQIFHEFSANSRHLLPLSAHGHLRTPLLLFLFINSLVDSSAQLIFSSSSSPSPLLSGFDLLSGEIVLHKSQSVTSITNFGDDFIFRGTLFITNYQVVFSKTYVFTKASESLAVADLSVDWVRQNGVSLSPIFIPLGSIARIRKIPSFAFGGRRAKTLTLTQAKDGLEINCHNGMVVRFGLELQKKPDQAQIFITLEKFASPTIVSNYFAFYNTTAYPDSALFVYDARAEFTRQR